MPDKTRTAAIAFCAILLASTSAGYGDDTAHRHPEPWPIWNWRNHQPTQRQLDALHKRDVTPEQAREIDRLYMQLEGSGPGTAAKPRKRN